MRQDGCAGVRAQLDAARGANSWGRPTALRTETGDARAGRGLRARPLHAQFDAMGVGARCTHQLGTSSIIIFRLTRVPRSETVSAACSPLGGACDCGMYSGIHSPRDRSLSTARRRAREQVNYLPQAPRRARRRRPRSIGTSNAQRPLARSETLKHSRAREWENIQRKMDARLRAELLASRRRPGPAALEASYGVSTSSSWPAAGSRLAVRKRACAQPGRHSFARTSHFIPGEHRGEDPHRRNIDGLAALDDFRKLLRRANLRRGSAQSEIGRAYSITDNSQEARGERIVGRCCRDDQRLHVGRTENGGCCSSRRLG